MKTILAAILAMAGVASVCAQPPTALTSLKDFGRVQGNEALEQVVGLVGFYGQDQPKQWMILSRDPKAVGLMHEHVIREGKVVAVRHFQRTEGQDLPSITLPAPVMKVDSNQVFLAAEREARAAGIGFDSVHYQLRCRDLRNEPVWVLNLIDQRQKAVGVLYISAVNGQILRKNWIRPGTREYERRDTGEELRQAWNQGVDFISDKFHSVKDRLSSSGTTTSPPPTGAGPRQTQPQPPQAQGPPSQSPQRPAGTVVAGSGTTNYVPPPPPATSTPAQPRSTAAPPQR